MAGRDRALTAAVRWNLTALVLAVLTSLGMALLPLGTEATQDASGKEIKSRTSLLENEGVGVLAVLAVPVVLVAIPLMLRTAGQARRARLVLSVVLGASVFLGAASVGLFYLPTLAAMITSASQGQEPPPPPLRPAAEDGA